MTRMFSCLVLVGILCCIISHSSRADWGGGSRLDGAWRMVSPELPEGVEHIKIVVGGRFVWTWIKDGKVIRAAGGRYTVRGDRYVEVIEHVQNQKDAWMVGKTFSFSRELKRGNWLHKGELKEGGRQYEVNEVWERAER